MYTHSQRCYECKELYTTSPKVYSIVDKRDAKNKLKIRIMKILRETNRIAWDIKTKLENEHFKETLKYFTPNTR